MAAQKNADVVRNPCCGSGGTAVLDRVMMGLADVTLYAALSVQNRAGAVAVTTNLNINFYAKPVAHSPYGPRGDHA